MIVKRSAVELFSAEPDLDRVPPETRRSGKKQVLLFRPPLQLPGVGLILKVTPSKRQLFNHIISKLIHLELTLLEREWALTLGSIELMHNPLDRDILTMFELLEFSSKGVSTEGRTFLSRNLRLSLFLSFEPTLAVARNEVIVSACRRWVDNPRIVRPQRKLGYDDQGTLAPPDTLKWQEIAMSNAEQLNSDETDLTTLVTRLRTAWGVCTEETPKDLNDPKVETFINLTYRRFRK